MDRAPLTPTEFTSAVSAITSAFGDPTRRDIYLFAHQSPDGVTSSETAKHFDLHVNVARHHLDKLTAGGYLDTAGERKASGVGRPSKRYCVTTPHVDLEFGVRHHDILVTLLGKALSMLSDDQAATMAEDVGREYGRKMATTLGGAGTSSFRSALHTVADALSSHGFAAHAEKSGDELRIVSENCPFGDAAVEHPVICAVDRGMVQGMLAELHGETTIHLASSIPMGDEVCVTTVAGTTDK